MTDRTVAKAAIRFRSYGRSYYNRIVAWCRDHSWHLPEDAIGQLCPAADCRRKLIRRRMWVCDVTECQQAYKKLEDAKNHKCFSEY